VGKSRVQKDTDRRGTLKIEEEKKGNIFPARRGRGQCLKSEVLSKTPFQCGLAPSPPSQTVVIFGLSITPF
jgi:hypothetical protein